MFRHLSRTETSILGATTKLDEIRRKQGLTLDPLRRHTGNQIERSKRQMRTVPTMFLIRKWVCLSINSFRNSAQSRHLTQLTTTLFSRVV